jgi:hypothetical protein
MEIDERQALSERTQPYEGQKDAVPSHLRWLFATLLQVRIQFKQSTLMQWINEWTTIIENSYTTALEIG